MRRPVQFGFSRRRLIAPGLVALVSAVGVLLAPTASEAAPRPRPTTTTTTIPKVASQLVVPALAADTLPASDDSSAAAPDGATTKLTLPTLPNLGGFFGNLLASIQKLLADIFARLCKLLGGFFCASP